MWILWAICLAPSLLRSNSLMLNDWFKQRKTFDFVFTFMKVRQWDHHQDLFCLGQTSSADPLISAAWSGLVPRNGTDSAG